MVRLRPAFPFDDTGKVSVPTRARSPPPLRAGMPRVCALNRAGTEPRTSAGMAEWYNHFAKDGSGLAPRNEALIAKLREENAAKLVVLQATMKDAEENLGDTEVKDAEIAIAGHFDKTGDMVRSHTLHPPRAFLPGASSFLCLSSSVSFFSVRAFVCACLCVWLFTATHPACCSRPCFVCRPRRWSCTTRRSA